MNAQDVELTDKLINFDLPYGRKFNSKNISDEGLILINKKETLKDFSYGVQDYFLRIHNIQNPIITVDALKATIIPRAINGKNTWGFGRLELGEISQKGEIPEKKLVFRVGKDNTFLSVFPIENNHFDIKNIDMEYIGKLQQSSGVGQFADLKVINYLNGLVKPKPISDNSSKKARDLFGGLMD